MGWLGCLTVLNYAEKLNRCCKTCSERKKKPRGFDPTRPPSDLADSEGELHGKLQLPRITHALAQEAIEIEQSRRYQRVDVVVVVEGVEHLQHRNQRVAVAEFNGADHAPVEGEVFSVLAQVVPAAVNSGHDASERVAFAAGWSGCVTQSVSAEGVHRNRLCGAGLHADVHFEGLGQAGVGEEVELVLDVAIREGVVAIEVEAVESAIGERIALVGVVVEVLRVNVISLELEAVAELLARADGDTTVERLSRALG